MTPADLAAAYGAAKPGDVLAIPPGRYGAFKVAKALTVQADPGALFDRVTIGPCADVTWEGGAIELPAAGAVSSTAALRIVQAQNVAVRGVRILGAIATEGVPETADPTADRPGDNIVGWPTGRGVSVEFCGGVTVEGCDISRVHKGVTLTRLNGPIAVRGNHIYNVRTSMIVGDAPSGSLIEDNHLHDSNPWKYGGQGDHGDFLHLWTPAGIGLTEPSRGVILRGNLLDQGAGTALLGLFLEDNSGHGYEDVLIEGNTILNGSAQGIALSHVRGVVRGNRLLQSAGTVKNAPAIYPRPLCALTVEGNTAADTYKIGGAHPNNTWLAPGVRPAAELEAARTAWRERVRGPTDWKARAEAAEAQATDLAAQLAASEAARNTLSEALERRTEALAAAEGACSGLRERLAQIAGLAAG